MTRFGPARIAGTVTRLSPALPLPLGRLVCCLLLLLPRPAGAGPSSREFPYRGHWSNGRGETLVVTADSLLFAGGRAVPYRDVTRAGDGHVFELQITARGEVNGFSGKFLSVTCRRGQMTVTDFASHVDLFQEHDPLGEVTWFQDDGDGDDDNDAEEAED